MKRLIVLMFLLLSSCSSIGVKNVCQFRKHHQIRIGILDTGLDFHDERFVGHICEQGHVNLTSGPMKDFAGHGTHVAGLIMKYAGEGDYCFVIYKYYDTRTSEAEHNMLREFAGLYGISKDNLDIVNFSGGGYKKVDEEEKYISEKTDTLFVVATGNDGINLDKSDRKYYPASYELNNLLCVQNSDSFGKRAKSSNWSKKCASEDGQYVPSTLPNGMMGELSGTSMSTAIRTGKIVREMLDSCQLGEKNE